MLSQRFSVRTATLTVVSGLMMVPLLTTSQNALAQRRPTRPAPYQPARNGGFGGSRFGNGGFGGNRLGNGGFYNRPTQRPNLPNGGIFGQGGRPNLGQGGFGGSNNRPTGFGGSGGFGYGNTGQGGFGSNNVSQPFRPGNSSFHNGNGGGQGGFSRPNSGGRMGNLSQGGGQPGRRR